MKNILWLIRREFWEHKVEFVWAPFAVSMLFIFLITLWAVGHNFLGFEAGLFIEDMRITGESLKDPGKLRTLVEVIQAGIFTFIGIQLTLTALIHFTYASNCLSSERRDRSVLFWKSLPSSDLQTITAKALTASVLIPAISIGILLVAVPLGTCILIWGAGGMSGAFVQNGHLGAMLLLVVKTMLAYLPLQIVWALPTVAWCILISSMARDNPSLKAFGFPAIAIAVIFVLAAMFVADTGDKVKEPIVGAEVHKAGSAAILRLITGTMPLAWAYINDRGRDEGSIFVLYGWGSVKPYEIILGALAAGLMLYGAMVMRKRATGD